MLLTEIIADQLGDACILGDLPRILRLGALIPDGLAASFQLPLQLLVLLLERLDLPVESSGQLAR